MAPTRSEIEALVVRIQEEFLQARAVRLTLEQIVRRLNASAAHDSMAGPCGRDGGCLTFLGTVNHPEEGSRSGAIHGPVIWFLRKILYLRA